MEQKTINQETQEVLNGFFMATAANDPAAITAHIADDVDFYIAESPMMPWTGRKTTKSEVLKALHMLTEGHIEGEEEFEPGHTFIDGGEAAVFGVAGRTVRATGKKFKASFCMRFTIKDKKIIKFLMLEDSHEIEKAYQMP